MDHFVLAIVSDEAEWKKWYENPLKEPMPKIEMEFDTSDGNNQKIYIHVFFLFKNYF